MDVREEHNILVSLNGKPMGRINKVYSMSCQFDGPIPDWLKGTHSEGESKRRELEAAWRSLPEETRTAAHEAARLLGSILYKLGAHGLSVDAMAEGRPCTLSITLDKKNAD